MEMRELQVVIIRLSWRSLILAVPCAFLALLFIPTAILLVGFFEKLGWVKFVAANDDNTT